MRASRKLWPSVGLVPTNALVLTGLATFRLVGKRKLSQVAFQESTRQKLQLLIRLKRWWVPRKILAVALPRVARFRQVNLLPAPLLFFVNLRWHRNVPLAHDIGLTVAMKNHCAHLQ
jgi:hypothetical protein